MAEKLNIVTLMILCVPKILENPESCVSVTAELHSILCTLKSQDITQPTKKKLRSLKRDSIKHETSRMFPLWSVSSAAGKKGTFKILL